MAKKVVNLDMSKADGYALTESNIVLRANKKHGIEGNLLYSGLEGKKLETLLKHGTLYPASKYIWAAVEPDTREPATALSCAAEHRIPMIAVYEGSHFVEKFPEKFYFNNPEKKLDSLLIVYLLDYHNTNRRNN